MHPTSSKITLGKEKKRARKEEERTGRKKAMAALLAQFFFSLLATLEIVSADVFKNPA